MLDMWSFIEEGYAKLSDKDKERVALEGGPFGEHVKFQGFNGKLGNRILRHGPFLDWRLWNSSLILRDVAFILLALICLVTGAC